MALLHGLVVPLGDGMVIEVHLDIMDLNPAFLRRLNALGFEDDPFLDFYPPEYRFHYTGRTRACRIPHGDIQLERKQRRRRTLLRHPALGTTSRKHARHIS